MLKLLVSVGALLAFIWFVTWLVFYIRRQILAIRAEEQRRKDAEWQESVRQMEAMRSSPPLLWSPVKEEDYDALPTQKNERDSQVGQDVTRPRREAS